MARPIALIHAALSNGRSWHGFLEALALEDLEPILVELPGHGAADPWDRSRDYSDQALEVLVDALPREPVPVIGHSFGAVIALRAVIEKPGRVSSLVAIEPPFYAALEGSYMHEKAATDMAAVHKKVEDGSLVSAAREFVGMWGTGQPWDEMAERERKQIIGRMDLVMAAGDFLWKDPKGLLGPGRLEKVDIPVTLVEGDASHQSVTPIIDALGRRIPDAEGIIVPGAGHMVPITHPYAVAEAVRERLVWGFPDD